MSRVITVTGDIPADDLGTVLVHEHVFCALAGADLDPRLSLDEDAAVAEAVAWLRAVAAFGVRTVVDATPITWYRRPDMLRRVSETAEVNIIASTGMHTERMGWPFHLKLFSAGQLAEVFTLEIEKGMLHTDVRAGIIKLATGQTAVSKYERRAIDAAAAVQKSTGVGIITHTEGADGAYSQLDAFKENGVDLDRVLIGHVDNSTDESYHLDIIKQGGQIGFDRIGHYLITPDGPRLNAIHALIAAGHSDRIMLSHDAVASYLGDFFITPELSRWREYGFTYLFREVIPELRDRGIDDAVFERMLVSNTRRLLAPA
jgi:phosphotriesterase-related protein